REQLNREADEALDSLARREGDRSGRARGIANGGGPIRRAVNGSVPGPVELLDFTDMSDFAGSGIY
ncbi:MAG: hypothetical protein L0Z50_28825, partial [Verrucomicrobiales bacterium]|nr:hypothetical protein [Verrucomicrobiales bacterium]